MTNKISIELWDHIASFIRDPSTLLQFALTSSRFCTLIIPTHLDYCAVSAYACNDAFWTELTPKKAGRLNDLSIAGLHSTFDTPWGNSSTRTDTARSRRILPWNDPFDSACASSPIVPIWAMTMGSVAPTMVGIQILTLAFSVCDVARLSRSGFFANLPTSQLDVFDLTLRDCYHSNAQEQMKDALMGLRDLKGGYSRFDFTCCIPQEGLAHVLDTIAGVLNGRCPDLRHLQVQLGLGPLEYAPPWASLWDATWPYLQTLSLRNVQIGHGEYDAVSAFLVRHRRIEVLRSDAVYDMTFDLSLEDALPRLRELLVCGLGVEAVRCMLEQYGDSYRPIESLWLRTYEAAESDIRQTIDLLCQHGGRVGSLRRLAFKTDPEFQPESRSWLRLIGQCNPHLAELVTNPSDVCAHEIEWLELLAWFPNLEILRGYELDCWIVYNDDEEDQEVEFPDLVDLVREHQARLPKLREFNECIKVSENVWRYYGATIRI